MTPNANADAKDVWEKYRSGDDRYAGNAADRGPTGKTVSDTEGRAEEAHRTANPLSEWETAVSAFNNAESCFFQRKTPKKTRDIEIKQYMIGQLEIEANDGLIELSASVKITQQGSVKPAEILEYLRKSSGSEYDISNVEIRRTALLCGGRNLMDVM